MVLVVGKAYVGWGRLENEDDLEDWVRTEDAGFQAKETELDKEEPQRISK